MTLVRKLIVSDELRDILKDRCFTLSHEEPFYIYGTGRVAHLLYQGLVHRGDITNLAGFVETSCPENDGRELFGKPIWPVQKIPREALILVAVHFIWEKEIESTLKRLGFHRYVMIYSQMLKFRFGEPVACHEKIEPKRLLSLLCTYPEIYYQIATYTAVIQHWFHDSQGTERYYLKFHTKLASRKAAEERLIRFRSMLSSCEQKGASFLQQHIIYLDEHQRVLDGMHRVLLAVWYQVPFLYADCYETQDYWGMGYEKGHLGYTYSEIFTPEEFQALDAMKEIILTKINQVKS